MELYQLKYFNAVFKYNSFTKAAEKLHVTQPTITVAVQKLENELGVSLFERRKKQLVITSIGKIIQKRVKNILDEVDNLKTEVEEYKSTKTEVIRLGMPLTICAEMLIPLFNDFVAKKPCLEVVTVQYSMEVLTEMVKKNELDIACIPVRFSPGSMESKPFHSEQIFVCFQKDSKLSEYEKVPFSALSNDPILFGTQDAYVRQAVTKVFKQKNIKPCIAMSSRIHPIMVRNLVAQGVGIAFLTYNILHNQDNVDYRPLDPPVFIEMGLIWRKEKYLTKAQQKLIQFVCNLNNF